MPSSTTTAVRPASGVRGRLPRKRMARRSSSARSDRSTAATSSSPTLAMASTSGSGYARRPRRSRPCRAPADTAHRACERGSRRAAHPALGRPRTQPEPHLWATRAPRHPPRPRAASTLRPVPARRLPCPETRPSDPLSTHARRLARADGPCVDKPPDRDRSKRPQRREADLGSRRSGRNQALAQPGHPQRRSGSAVGRSAGKDGTEVLRRHLAAESEERSTLAQPIAGNSPAGTTHDALLWCAPRSTFWTK